jgi:hypothetical protein
LIDDFFPQLSLQLKDDAVIGAALICLGAPIYEVFRTRNLGHAAFYGVIFGGGLVMLQYLAGNGFALQDANSYEMAGLVIGLFLGAALLFVGIAFIRNRFARAWT